MENKDAKVFERRRDLLRKRCRGKKTDGYLTFDFSDVFYLSGFPSEGCFALVSAAGDFIFAPLLLAGHLRAHIGRGNGLEIVEDRKLLRSLGLILKKNRLRKIGYDPEKATVSLLKQLERFGGASWAAQGGFVLTQRMIKDESEVASISRACHITHESSRLSFESLEEGQSEEDLALRLQDLFRKRGSSKPAFETIVAFGENSAFPHHVATAKKLTGNSVVLMDLGCTLNGYRSDLTRTEFFGKISRKFKEVHDIVKKSQAAGIDQVRDGVSAGRVDFVCREVIRKYGYGDRFIHGTGHGVGLDIHEPPRLGAGSKTVLKEGMVVTVEPGIYLPGEFGVRIEDTVLVKKNGCEILTK
jgi:Xaa-Pro aminopeptidase